MNCFLSSIMFASILFLGALIHQSQDDHSRSGPLEEFNRSIFNFNYKILDYYLVRPAAVAWQDYVPKLARNGLGNFFSNLEEPAFMVNYFFKGKPYKAMVHFNRFFLNSLLGMGGLIDVASMANLKLLKEDALRFGSTLGHYGVGYGPYIQLPGYGSFTFREDIGGLVDDFYPMLSYLTYWMFVGKWMLEGLETRAQLLDSDALLRNSQDPYAMMRAAYFQRHDFLVRESILTLQEDLKASLVPSDLDSIDTQ